MKRGLPKAMAALEHRDFTLLWGGQFFLTLGTQVQTVALAWLVYALSGSAALLGGLGLARAIPTILLSLFGGTLADQLDRRRLLFLTQSALAGFSVLLALAVQDHLANVALLYVYAILTAAITSIDSPTRQAFLPGLVPRDRIANALTLTVVTSNVAAVAGPALGGVIIARVGAAACFWLGAGCCVVVVGSLAVMHARPELAALPRRGLGALVDGLAFVRDRPILWQLMVIDFFAVLFASRSGLLPVYAANVFKVGAQGLGLLYAAVSFGAVLGAVVVAVLPHPRHPGRMVGLTTLAYGAVLGVFGLTHSFVVGLALLAASGGLDAVSMVMRQTARQLITPDNLRGRVGALSSIFSAGGPRLGEFQSGIAASLLGAGSAMVVGGGACIVMALTSLHWARALWRYRGDDVHPADAGYPAASSRAAAVSDVDAAPGAE
ncbi:MAG TPA: MFS transporter [Thermomicrobiaceae bacterium]|nr:MFS transporter [Thermomicrobiaceae bacterium]